MLKKLRKTAQLVTSQKWEPYQVSLLLGGYKTMINPSSMPQTCHAIVSTCTVRIIYEKSIHLIDITFQTKTAMPNFLEISILGCATDVGFFSLRL